MARFLLKVFLQAALTFVLSFTLLFLLLRGLGDPAQMLLGQRSDRIALETIRAQLHLDKPLWQQYLYAWAQWMPYDGEKWKLPQLGTSYQYARPVVELYAERFPATLLLSLCAMMFAVCMGIPLGLWQAYRPSFLLQRLSLLFLSLPGYVVGLLLLFVMGFQLGMPLGGYIYSYDPIAERLSYHWENLLLPALALGLRPAAHLLQLTSTEAQHILQQDFIRSAHARGKAFLPILFGDVLRNILPTLSVSLTQWLGGLFTGALFVEEVFDWPGVGKLLFFALSTSDYPLLMGIAQLSVLLFVGLNALG
ncbi:MAG: ABC transporter permease, partial [Bacteroidia bacterium]|nr:ABC transporter permease [Bacteroidia bacterium]